MSGDIAVVSTPLVECRVEALMRPVRSDWAAVTAGGRTLERVAGEAWRERCSAQGRLPVGAAAITDAGELGAEFVIHVSVAGSEGGPTPRSVEVALENALRRLREWEIRDLAVPLLGTGPGGLDLEECCRIMAPVLSEFAGGERGRVRVCVEDPAVRDVARRTWPGEVGGEPAAG